MRNHRQYLTKTSAISKATASNNWLMKWMFASFIGLSLTLFALINPAHAEEVNPYAKNYKEQNTGNLKSQDMNPDTKIFASNHKEEDNISMLENGYDLIGTSGFSATEASPDLALQHAKAIKADTVLVYKKYESAATASSRLQLIKEAAKKGGEIDPNDLEEGPTQYQYFASYWAKLPMPAFGVHVIKLRKNVADSAGDGAAKIEEISGLKVIAVIKGSPAAKANIFRGDTLLKIGDVPLVSAEDLFTAVSKYRGQAVSVELERNGVISHASQVYITQR